MFAEKNHAIRPMHGHKQNSGSLELRAVWFGIQTMNHKNMTADQKINVKYIYRHTVQVPFIYFLGKIVWHVRLGILHEIMLFAYQSLCRVSIHCLLSITKWTVCTIPRA